MAGRFHTHGMPAMRIEKSDVIQIYGTAKEFIKKIGEGNGPAFVECCTCRWKEHVGPNDDYSLGYRTVEEVDCWKREDQLARLRKMLRKETIGEIDSRVDKEIDIAFRFAENSLFPQQNELFKDLFKE